MSREVGERQPLQPREQLLAQSRERALPGHADARDLRPCGQRAHHVDAEQHGHGARQAGDAARPDAAVDRTADEPRADGLRRGTEQHEAERDEQAPPLGGELATEAAQHGAAVLRAHRLAGQALYAHPGMTHGTAGSRVAGRGSRPDSGWLLAALAAIVPSPSPSRPPSSSSCEPRISL